MTFSSSLTEEQGPIILDTSVLINLHASTYGTRILSTLPNKVLVSEIVAAELEHETSRLNGEHKFLRGLIASGNVHLVSLAEDEQEAYAKLVSGSVSLDDGEAATIAIASSRGIRPVIDERKGRLVAQAGCLKRGPCWSLDVFQHPQILSSFGEDDAVEALYLALRDGRMRICESHCEHVIGLIGPDRALDCKSLPGYKVRRVAWEALTSQAAAKF
jgi:predicted nucleic acid-binding protein